MDPVQVAPCGLDRFAVMVPSLKPVTHAVAYVCRAVFSFALSRSMLTPGGWHEIVWK
jgi:hypothetical protein